MIARDQQGEHHKNKGAPHVGDGHQPTSLEAVRERAGGQSQHEPGECVGCRHRRHGKRMRIHEEGKERNGSVAEAVAEARHGEGRPEIAEPSPQRTASPGRGPRAASTLVVFAALLEGHSCLIARILAPPL